MDKIIRSPFDDVQIPDNVSLPEFVLSRFNEFGSQIAMVCAKTRKSLSYQQLVAITNQLIGGLLHFGVSKGHVIGVCIHNCFEYVPLSLSVTSLGAIFATSNPDYTEDELLYQFNQCKMRYVIVDDFTVDKVLKIRARCPSVKVIFYIGSKIFENVVNYHELLRNQKTCSTSYSKIDPKRDVAFYLSSSGTTGLPKSVMLTHYNIVSMMNQLQSNKSKNGEMVQYCTKRNEPYVTVFQYCNIAGIVCTVLRPMALGSICIALFPKYQSKSFLDAIQTFRPVTLFVPPPTLVYMAKTTKAHGYDLSSVKAVLCGGAPLSKEVIQLSCKLLNIPYITEEYGMTETSSITHMTPWCSLSAMKHGSCGVPVANTQFKIVDVQSGEVLGANERGEVCVKGPQMTIGYLDNEKATKETIDGEGWLHTGDIGFYDSDRYLFIVDRIKELIKVKGYQVAPAELEDLLLRHPKIADAAVFGCFDEYCGEQLKALVVAKPNVEITPKEVQDFVASKVVSYKHLDGGVRIVDVIPKSPSGKILRRLIRENEEKSHVAKSKI